MNTLLSPLKELEAFDLMGDAVRRGESPIQVSGCIESQKAHVISGLDEGKIRLVIVSDEIRAKEIVEDLKLYTENVIYYPPKDFIFFSADVHGKALAADRLKAINAIMEFGEGRSEAETLTVVTTIDGGMDYCLPFALLRDNMIHISVGDTLDLEELKKKLVFLGYESVGQVQSEGEFSARGGIIDVFPLTDAYPFRVELWGDEVDGIRRIDVDSQRSVENVQRVSISPASEVFLSSECVEDGMKRMREDMAKSAEHFRQEGHPEYAARLESMVEDFCEMYDIYPGMVNIESMLGYFDIEKQSFFDYFQGQDLQVIIDEPAMCIERGETIEREFRESSSERLEKGYILPKQVDILFPLPQVLGKLSQFPVILMSMLDQKVKEFKVAKKFEFHVQPAPSYNNNFSLLVKDIKKYKKNGYRVVLLTGSGSRGERLSEDLRDFEVENFYRREQDRELKPGEVMISKGVLRKGFEYPEIRLIVMTEGEIFSRVKKKKRHKRYNGPGISNFKELKIGDYVVHESHGLGIYQGIEKITVDKVVKDYLKVSYAGGSNLYIPATSLELLQKYAGKDAEKKPKLNKLGSPEWGRTKTKVRGALEEIASELVELYAKRESKQGYQFERDTVWQKEFEEIFPYEETDDQMKAIEETKKDMESTKIMDRLVCGDVGFGKTEVAIRAAFKAVMSGKQVAVLVPTTILAGQHYNTFVQRMKDFSIEVGMLSRLRTPKQQKETIAKLKKGLVDVVIGTHRVLGKDVEFKDLGLLIIDEEQRFGVTHKEKIKQMKNDVDVLTLTATPIPRTLHMSLVGIRDMSLIEEAPVDRMPIQTYVMERDEQLMREAILREVARGGQVYYVYNRVANMDYIANKIAKLVPEAEVAFAHGQMNERQLEDTMYSFVNGEIDVLVSTTIVETGLDIPNVNTIIIDEADKLGLSQLYQLRGRVGRSNRTAFAFLMYKKDKVLTEIAEKRLAAIKEFTELGSGFRISMSDLEIRGAGNILGARQHGHMEAVGYDLYCKMLGEAIKRQKGEKPKTDDYETSIEVKVDAYIPESYIPNEIQRLDIYKRISEVENEEEKDDLVDELIDRFGDIPTSVDNLLEIALLKACARDAFITSITDKSGELRVYMYHEAPVDVARIPELMQKYRRRLKFVAGKEPYFVFVPEKGKLLPQLFDLVSDIGELKLEMEKVT
ncbi:transcription-repair coupling factor [Eubacterium xylanophilum]|uniref:transcription-repair coupling factor n=1 Tax=Eubacterium xylanophilum TaxID=39497 RepID=UPI00047C46AD|nr:transcription-repair coupling factor [Eubacterium xylanophilum]